MLAPRVIPVLLLDGGRLVKAMLPVIHPAVSLFVFQGKLRAVLISTAPRTELIKLLPAWNAPESPPR